MSSNDYLRQADAAFLGDAIAARLADPESVIQGEARLSGPETIYTVDVQDVYKGQVGKRLEVSSSMDGASCGAGLQVNHRYVVYATEGKADYGQRSTLLYTGLCHGTYEPDGVNSFPLAGGSPMAPGPHAGEDAHGPDEAHEHGQVDLEGMSHGAPIGEEAPRPGVSPTAFAGLMLVSAAIAAALVALAGRR